MRDNMRLQVDLTCLSSQPGLRRADRSVNRIFTLVNLLFSRGALTIFHEMNTSQSDKKQSVGLYVLVINWHGLTKFG